MARKPTPQDVIDTVNADLRARFGETITRQQFLAYSNQFGIWPGWIRTDKSLRRGRGVYAIPEPGYVVPRREVQEERRRYLTPQAVARLRRRTGRQQSASPTMS